MDLHCPVLTPHGARDLVEGQVGDVMERNRLLLSSWERSDGPPKVQGLVDIWLHSFARFTGTRNPPMGSSNLVESCRHDPSNGPRLIADSLPAFKSLRERFLGSIGRELGIPTKHEGSLVHGLEPALVEPHEPLVCFHGAALSTPY
jgi:hypothetical protein